MVSGLWCFRSLTRRLGGAEAKRGYNSGGFASLVGLSCWVILSSLSAGLFLTFQGHNIVMETWQIQIIDLGDVNLNHTYTFMVSVVVLEQNNRFIIN